MRPSQKRPSPARPPGASPRPTSRPVGLLLAALVATGIAGCDNSACIFSAGNCIGAGSPAGALGAAAAQPARSSWILPTNPTLQDAAPEGAGVDTRSPVVLRFSESLAPSSVSGAFVINRVDTTGISIPLPTTALVVGDGRLVVLTSQAGLTPSTDYEVGLTANAAVRDVTGQPFQFASGALLTSFTTAATNSDEIGVVATFPPDNAFDQSETGEIVVVFDRPLDETTVTGDSWVVKVDGSDPTIDPVPSQGQGNAVFGIPTPEPRVWRWRSVDPLGDFVPLGREVEITLTLSPATDPILDLDANELATTEISYRTASVLAPGAVRITSTPMDAIGIDALTPGSGSELTLEVDVDDAEDGDRLDLYFFGPDPADPTRLLAIRRAFDFTEPGPFAVADLLREDLDLTSSTSPLTPRFGDGSIHVAASFTSGPITTPVTLFDADVATAGAQPALLDTVPPEITSFDFPSFGTDEYVYDAGDVVFEGVASEPIVAMTVSTGLGSTPVQAPVFTRGNRFASEPVELGVVPSSQSPLPYTVTVKDRAGNSSASAVTGDLTQVGFVGETVLAPAGAGDPIAVHVYDASTRAPLAGALVLSHADPAGSGTPTFVSNDTTAADGTAVVTSHASGDDGTIVTVLLDGYDIVSVHDFGSARLSIGLDPTGAGTPTVRGSVKSTVSQVLFALTTGDVAYVDGRRTDGGSDAFAGSVCTTSPFGQISVTCPYGPEPVRAFRSGSIASFGGVFDQPESSFTSLLFLSTYALAWPLAPVAPGVQQTIDLTISNLLTDPSVPPTEGAIDLGALSFDASGATGLDLGSLVDDDVFPGEVRVRVEADFGGSAPPVPAGVGASYDQGSGLWNLRGAWAGAVSAALADSFDPLERLSVVAELSDTSGASSGVRTSFQDVLLGAIAYSAPPVPTILSPATTSTVGSGAFTVEVENTLVDGALGGTLGSGVYRLTLRDSAGRAWHHWRPDVADTDGAVVFFVPDLTGTGEAGLADGTLTAAASAFAWTGFDPLGFFFSDLRTRPEVFATGAEVEYTKP
ncbi:MAG: Ig-like domain-containing protein [Planctomycetota bacterium]